MANTWLGNYGSATDCVTTSVWGGWTQSCTTNTVTVSSTSATWNGWAGQQYHQMDCGTAGTGTWYVWVNPTGQMQAQQTGQQEYYQQRQYVQTPETEEQKVVRLAREEAYKVEAEAKAKVEAEKSARALALLMLLLNHEQQKSLEEKKYFELKSVKTGNRYRIRKGFSMNVDLLKEDGTLNKSLCFHPDGYHDYDVMALQKLMLEDDEERVAEIIKMPELLTMRAVGAC